MQLDSLLSQQRPINPKANKLRARHHKQNKQAIHGTICLSTSFPILAACLFCPQHYSKQDFANCLHISCVFCIPWAELVHGQKPWVLGGTQLIVEIFDVVSVVLGKNDIDLISVLRDMKAPSTLLAYWHQQHPRKSTYKPRLYVISLGSGCVLIQVTIWAASCIAIVKEALILSTGFTSTSACT